MARPVDPPRSGERLPAAGERIAKLLARAGVASRREVERMVAEGRVAVNGVAIGTPATVLPSLDGVTVDGAPVAKPEPARLFLYHKPTGLLVTERDPRGRPTIYDRLPPDLPRLVPVGRLDLNTEGLLLLTTDGGLKRQLELPSSGVERTYRARAYGQVTQAQLEALIEGVEIDGIRYGAIDANLERRTGANVWIELTLTEGKNREVRRVLEHLGLEVSRLIRTRYGPFVLGDLPANGIGEVRERDLAEFRRSLDRREKAQRPIEVPANAAAARSRPKQVPSASRHPGEGRGPVATPSKAKRPRPPQASSGRPTPKLRVAPPSAPQPGPGLRRGGDQKPSGEPEQQGDQPRQAKPKRKSGWAKPKPRTGPARPKRPRG